MSATRTPTKILHVAKAILAVTLWQVEAHPETPARFWRLANAEARRVAVLRARAAIKAYEEVRL